MSYQVLARKLRPSEFSALVGQQHIVKALTHALDNDRVHQAFLFTGTRGVGKTTIARILAKCLNCEQGVSSAPCGECVSCQEISEGRFVDLIEVDAASRTGVDATRELLEGAQYPPVAGRYKVLLIDEVHQLSTHAFNAMLKTLEEPPPHAKFVLATTDPKKVPATILSRCLQFQLKNLSAEAISDYLASVLASEAIEFEPGALTVIGRAARGSMRDALSITDQVISFGAGKVEESAVNDMLGVVGRDQLGAIMAAIKSGSADRLLAVSAELAENSADFRQILRDIMAVLHEQAVEVSLSRQTELQPEQIQLYYQTALLGNRDMPFAPDERTGFEMTLLRMLQFAPTPEGQSVPPSLTDNPDTPIGEAPAAAIEEPAADKNKPAADNNKPAADKNKPAAENSTTNELSTANPSAQSTHSSAGEVASEPARETAPSSARESSPAPAQAHADNTDARAASDDEAANDVAVEVDVQPIADEPELAQWYSLVDNCPLKGVALMLAQNSVPQPGVDNDMTLLLDASHEMLASERHMVGLSQWLSESLGKTVHVTAQLETPAHETWLQRQQRQAAERLASARASLEADSTVQILINEFGGELTEVTPLDAPPEMSEARLGNERN
ncbi:MAG: DNA polymerase III subunit gamma/tau [Pseudomonadaceae bacterium]|nr:DNA polymerase III subunit gamma/tau [Pseudomonadaceae bacterium]